MTEYVKGTPEMREDLIDFGNFVFSQAHVPHDFKALLPKAYGDAHDISRHHYVAVRDGRIRAMIACLPMQQCVAGTPLQIGLVGTVSVHPYARGEGHMKKLMADMLSEQREKGTDLLVLGGQRQRYNYFGFEHAGYQLNFSLSQASIRHRCASYDTSEVEFHEITDNTEPLAGACYALYQQQRITGARPREDYLDIMHSWNGCLYAVLRKGEFMGSMYTQGGAYSADSDSILGEVLLTEESFLPHLCKAWMEQRALNHITLPVAPFEKERIPFANHIAESYSIGANHMIRVMNWQKVLAAYLTLKHTFQPLEDGSAVVKIDDQTLRISVSQGTVQVTPDDAQPDLTWTHMEAQQALFGLDRLCLPQPACLRNWAPLPLYLYAPDTF